MADALEERFKRMFEGHEVLGNIRRAACLVLYRFTITGICDGMYICNTIAHESGCSDGQGDFTEPAKIDTWGPARTIQSSYSGNIGQGDINELAVTLESGRLDYSMARAGMLRDMRELKRQHTSADPWRKNYLKMQLSQKQKDIALLIETFGGTAGLI